MRHAPGHHYGYLMDRYLKGLTRHLKVIWGLSEATTEAYCSKVIEFQLWAKEKDLIDIQEITRQDVEKYLEWCFYRGNSNSTRVTKLIAIQRFFRYLTYEEIIPKDITIEIPRPRVRRNFIQKFTKEDILKFFSALNITTEKGLRDVIILILAAFAGLRLGEIVKLRLYDIMDHGKSVDICIPEAIGKQQSSRQVYLWKAPSLFVQQWIATRLSHGAKAEDPLIISYRSGGRGRGGGKPTGRRMLACNVDSFIKNLAGKAGVRKPAIKMHMFRATHASDLRQIYGYDIAAIAERLGHKNISTTDRYLPARGRVQKIYPSLHVYWLDFINIWKKKEESLDNDTGGAGNANK